jgi:organic hydroperoxide reductase OsmC/OhrA
VAVKAKELRYEIDLAAAERLGADCSPEELLLAALIRCSVKSLDYHARRAGNALEHAQGSARALITKRESDGRYATTEVDVELAVRFRHATAVDELFEKAERDCFIGASLTAKPRYTWSLV